LPERKNCELERKKIIASFAKTVEAYPLKAKLEIKNFIQDKKLKRNLDKLSERGFKALPVCEPCFEHFYHMLNEIDEKLSCFPEIPVIKKSKIRNSQPRR